MLANEVADEDALEAEVARLSPAETLIADDDAYPAFIEQLKGVRKRAPWLFDSDSGQRKLEQFFKVQDLSAFGIQNQASAIAAAGALLGYVEETQKQQLPHLTHIATEPTSESITLNAATRRHLELDTRVDGDVRHTLLGVLDSTRSPMGGRLLRRWLQRPLRDQSILNLRLHAVEALMQSNAVEDLRDVLRGLGDMERILSRVALRSARPRDLSTLRDGLTLAPQLQQTLSRIESPMLASLAAELGGHADTQALLQRAVVEHPPMLARDGGVIAEGFDAELDELRRLSTHADQFLVDLELREREASGIANLKVGYNRVHGYYIEISKGQIDRAPTHYTRRQTLANAERYITEE
jgi:DNA mismatch repair protein MutS